MPETIKTKFDVSTLPKWAQRIPAVVALCRRDYAFRCNVGELKDAGPRDLMRKHLIRTAERAEGLTGASNRSIHA